MSVVAPSLPANAPFSPLQRAWLDGFLAGLLGDDAGAAAGEPIPSIAAPALADEPEDFP